MGIFQLSGFYCGAAQPCVGPSGRPWFRNLVIWTPQSQISSLCFLYHILRDIYRAILSQFTASCPSSLDPPDGTAERDTNN